MESYVFKKNNFFKKMNKRYFKVNMNLIICYNEKGDNIPKDYIYLNNCILNTFPNYFKKNLNYFEIITNKNIKYKLYCESSNYNNWINTISKFVK